jgi:tyrosine-protein kinase Etk/Wzc
MAPEAVAGDGDLDLRTLAGALWRRKGWILWPTILVAVLTTIGVNVVTPRYKSEARILYDGRENAFLRPEVDKTLNADRPPADPETLTSQVQIVLSRQFALDVIRQLKLGDLPEFDPILREARILHRILSILGIARDYAAMSPEERVLDSWNERLTAYSVDKSRVIVIEFQSSDPMLAAKITNAIGSTYLRMEQNLRLDQARGANKWLAGEIDQLRLRVADAEAKAEAFRARTNLLVGTNNTTLNDQQLGEINSQVSAARGQKADSETRAKIIRDMLRRGETIELFDIVNSELIRRLSEQRSVLHAQLAEQSTQLLDRHPRIMELKAQVGDLDTQIRREAEKLARSLENDARVASARVDASSANLDMVKKQAASTSEQDVQLRGLEREAKAQRDLLESYLAKYRETTARETIGTAPADAKIISAAIASNTPYFPKKVPIVSVATLITFILCAGLVATGELLRASSGAGVIPVGARPGPRVDLASRARASMTRRVDAEPAVMAASEPPPVPPPDSSPAKVGDVAQRLRANASPGRGVAVTGATPSTATTTGSLALARALAANTKVVLVSLVSGDAAVEALGLPGDTAGIVEVVRGAASFGQVIRRDKITRAHLVAFGRPELGIEAISKAYDHVILDGGDLSNGGLRLATIAPRGVVIAAPDAQDDATAAVDLMAAAGFADVAVMAPVAAGKGEPRDLAAA